MLRCRDNADCEFRVYPSYSVSTETGTLFALRCGLKVSYREDQVCFLSFSLKMKQIPFSVWIVTSFKRISPLTDPEHCCQYNFPLSVVVPKQRFHYPSERTAQATLDSESS